VQKTPIWQSIFLDVLCAGGRECELRWVRHHCSDTLLVVSEGAQGLTLADVPQPDGAVAGTRDDLV
jgi:hypothetical protein